MPDVAMETTCHHTWDNLCPPLPTVRMGTGMSLGQGPRGVQPAHGRRKALLTKLARQGCSQLPEHGAQLPTPAPPLHAFSEVEGPSLQWVRPSSPVTWEVRRS